MFKLKNYNSKISILIYFEDTGLCHYGHSLVSSNARRMKSASCEIFEEIFCVKRQWTEIIAQIFVSIIVY